MHAYEEYHKCTAAVGFLLSYSATVAACLAVHHHVLTMHIIYLPSQLPTNVFTY